MPKSDHPIRIWRVSGRWSTPSTRLRGPATSTPIQVLDPGFVPRTDFGAARPPTLVRGASAVAKRARAPRRGELRPALVNGTIGAVITRDGQPPSVMAFTVAGDKIVRIDVVLDTDRGPGDLAAAVPLGC